MNNITYYASLERRDDALRRAAESRRGDAISAGHADGRSRSLAGMLRRLAPRHHAVSVAR